MFANRSHREKLLLVTAGLVLLAMGYFVLRYKPRQTALTAAERETKAAREELTKLTIPSDPVEGPDQLQRQLQQVRQELEQQRVAGAALHGLFAPASAPESVRELNVEISGLARASGVTIRENLPSAPIAALKPPAGGQKKSGVPEEVKSPAGPFLDRQLLAELGREHYQQLTLESSFDGLRSFLNGLNRLKWRVVVVNFEVQVQKSPGEQSRQPLTTKLILAL